MYRGLNRIPNIPIVQVRVRGIVEVKARGVVPAGTGPTQGLAQLVLKTSILRYFELRRGPLELYVRGPPTHYTG